MRRRRRNRRSNIVPQSQPAKHTGYIHCWNRQYERHLIRNPVHPHVANALSMVGGQGRSGQTRLILLVAQIKTAFKQYGASKCPDSSSQATHAKMCPQYVEEMRHPTRMLRTRSDDDRCGNRHRSARPTNVSQPSISNRAIESKPKPITHEA